jgi:hypothetical protein
VGLEVADVDEARRGALDAIAEMRMKNPRLADDASEWTLVVVDASGAVLFTFPVDGGF